MDSEDACDKSTASTTSQTANNKGSSTKPRVRSNTISRHTKSQCKPSPLNTNTLPNPKSRGHHRSTTHPRTSVDSDQVPVTAQQLADFRVSASSVTAPVTPTSSTRAKNPNPTSSSSSGIDSALSVAALSYASQSGFLQDYSCFAGRTTPPPEYQEYSPPDEGELRLGHTYMTPLPRPSPSNTSTAQVPAPSEYQEPNVEPPPLPPLNVRPDSPECSASSLDDSLGSLKYQPPLLLTDYSDFPSSRSKGHKSKSKCKSASPRTPRTPDSGLHHDLIPESATVLPKSSSVKSSASVKTVQDAAALKSNAAALLQYAFEKNAASVSRKHEGARGVSSSAGSHDACGLCASLGSPWVDICRAVRASKTK